MSGTNYSAPADHIESDPMVHLSVHSLPQATQDAASRTRSGRMKMLLVWAICAAPVVASYLTYYVIRPQGRMNYGTLLSQPVPMPPDSVWSLQDLQGHVVKPSELKRQWLLVSIAGGACEATCEQNLYWQRQLREVLGKDKDRLDRVWFVTDQVPVREALLPALAQSWVLRAPEATVRAWFKPEDGQPLGAHLYLVDPHGDWMMRFPAHADPSRVKKDLIRLMKANEGWDEAGR